MHIEIDIPRPGLTALLLVGVVSVVTWTAMDLQITSKLNASAMKSESVLVGDHTDEWQEDTVAQGGELVSPSEKLQDAEQNLRRGRRQQNILMQKEEFLRYELKVLEDERKSLGSKVSDEVEEEFRESTRQLLALLQDEREAEQFILESLNQLRDAQGRATILAKGLHGKSHDVVSFEWPVDPDMGISAQFRDADYQARFGFQHNGIDILALQGTTIMSAADGIVKEVSDNNGIGFNSITIQHDNGAVTLYGHVTESLVREGERVYAGDEIALSGGRPGSAGAGFSTGPHLHFEVFINGVNVDPMDYLPSINTRDEDLWE